MKREIMKSLGHSEEEAQLLDARGKSLGLDPLARQIHLLKRKKKENGVWKEINIIQIGIEGFRLVAERGGKYDGQDPITYVVEREGAIVRTDVVLPKDRPVAAIAAIYKKGVSRPFVTVAHYGDYVQHTNEGAVSLMWRKWPIMLAKCAEASAFRKAFPDLSLGGVYEDSEITDSPDEYGSDGSNGENGGNGNRPPWEVFEETSKQTPLPQQAMTAPESKPQEPAAAPPDPDEKPATENQKRALQRLTARAGQTVDAVAFEDLSFSAAAAMIRQLNVNAQPQGVST